jgi:3-oxoacyl-[acyl-carrier-protein] synthase II
VITGLGAVTPVGLNVKETWNNILSGKSGVAPLTLFDTANFSVHFGASVKNFDITNIIPRKEAKKMDTFIHYGIAAGKEAIDDSGIEVTEQNAGRIGVAIGAGIGGLPGIESGYDTYLKGGPRKISPFFVPSNIINMIAGNLSIMYGMKGPSTAIATACSSGTHNISTAGRMIQYGDADVMIAGGAEMSTSKMGLGGFASARALSTRNEDPTAASRPWDKNRDGFVLGDGAGIIVLEEYEHAVKRGAKIYAELIGSGMSSDAYHMTMPSKGGEGAARCMVNAMNDARINADEIDYINAHGTSTPAGDLAETQAVKTALGNAADKVAVSSTKSMIGHLLGAAGGVEAIFSVLSIQDSVAPPTINLDNKDPECDLDYVPHIARQMDVSISMSNSFGFGGTNGTLLFRKI